MGINVKKCTLRCYLLLADGAGNGAAVGHVPPGPADETADGSRTGAGGTAARRGRGLAAVGRNVLVSVTRQVLHTKLRAKLEYADFTPLYHTI